MLNYMTAEEVALKHNITARHVQYLCRKGKIENAVKRAGVWFIPDSSVIPTKNTKSDIKGFKFVGTKSKIFNSAIELFVLKGFNDVSLKDITDHVGVRQSTVYNHFSSKQDILNTIYDFYCNYYLSKRPCIKDMECALRHESVMAIIGQIRYDFEEEYQQKMSDITKIIFQRIAIDERAKDISKSLILNEGIMYVEAVFNKGIEIGRFAPFDTHAMAVFINSIRLFTLYNWIIDPSPDNVMKLAQDEQAIYKYAASLITDLNPPITAGADINTNPL